MGMKALTWIWYSGFGDFYEIPSTVARDELADDSTEDTTKMSEEIDVADTEETDAHESAFVVCCERPPSWIFMGCGHKCICKPCARKQKLCVTVSGKQSKKGPRKVPLVLCPLCRTQTRVVPSLRHEGRVFET